MRTNRGSASVNKQRALASLLECRVFIYARQSASTWQYRNDWRASYHFLVELDLADSPGMLELRQFLGAVLLFLDSLRLCPFLLSFFNLLPPLLLRVGSALT